MKPFLLRWMALLVLLAAGCSGSDVSRCTDLPGGVRYCLQTTEGIAPFDVQQKVDIVFDGRQETLIAQLESDASGMRFAGLTPFGQKLVQLGFDNRDVKIEALPMKGLDPVLLLALVQLASWPADSVRVGLGDSAAIEEDVGQRSLVRDGKAIVVIRYTRGLPPRGDMYIQLPAARVAFMIVDLDGLEPK